MTLLQKIEFLRKERIVELSSWEREFISDIYEGVEGLPLDTTDEEIKEYLTSNQIEKVEEIWTDLGL